MRSAMRAASQLPGRGPTEVDIVPEKSDDDDDPPGIDLLAKKNLGYLSYFSNGLIWHHPSRYI